MPQSDGCGQAFRFGRGFTQLRDIIQRTANRENPQPSRLETPNKDTSCTVLLFVAAVAIPANSPMKAPTAKAKYTGKVSHFHSGRGVGPVIAFVCARLEPAS